MARFQDQFSHTLIWRKITDLFCSHLRSYLSFYLWESNTFDCKSEHEFFLLRQSLLSSLFRHNFPIPREGSQLGFQNWLLDFKDSLEEQCGFCAESLTGSMFCQLRSWILMLLLLTSDNNSVLSCVMICASFSMHLSWQVKGQLRRLQYFLQHLPFLFCFLRGLIFISHPADSFI